MNFISDILYWISTGLLVPVIVLLIILFCRAILLAGSFYGQYLSIRKTETLLRNELSKLTPDTVEELSSKLPENSRSLVITYMRQVLDTRDTPAQVQRLLANFEIAGNINSNGTRPRRTGQRRYCFHGLQYADRFRHHCSRTGSRCRRLPYTASETTLVPAGYDQP